MGKRVASGGIMGRKQLTYVVVEDGRDKGKAFLITEMAAYAAEKWATRLLFALINSGVELPNNIFASGMAGIAVIGIEGLTKLSYAQAEPLLDEMFSCVSVMPDPMKPNVTRPLIENDIEEVATRFILRFEILKLHINFSMPGKS